MIETKQKADTQPARAKRWRNMWLVRSDYLCATTNRQMRRGERYLGEIVYPSAEIAEQRAHDISRVPQHPQRKRAPDDLYLGPVAMDDGQ